MEQQQPGPCPETQQQFEQLWAQRCQRADSHARRLAAAAHHLGKQLARRDISKPEARDRLTRLAALPDPNSHMPTRLVPYHQSHAIIAGALRHGFRSVPGR
jgi:hypothetical protein